MKARPKHPPDCCCEACRPDEEEDMQRFIAWLLKGVIDEMKKHTTELARIATALEKHDPQTVTLGISAGQPTPK